MCMAYVCVCVCVCVCCEGSNIRMAIAGAFLLMSLLCCLPFMDSFIMSVDPTRPALQEAALLGHR